MILVHFPAQTHVCLVSAHSNGPDHADNLSITYVSCVKKIHMPPAKVGVYLDSGNLSMQPYVAATPLGLSQNQKFQQTSAYSVLSFLTCNYGVCSLVGIFIDMPFSCKRGNSPLWVCFFLCLVAGLAGWPKRQKCRACPPRKPGWCVSLDGAMQ